MALLKLVFLEGQRANSFCQGTPPFNRKTKGFSGIRTQDRAWARHWRLSLYQYASYSLYMPIALSIDIMRTLVTTYLCTAPKWPAGIQAQDLLNTNWMFLPLSCWGNGRRIAHKLHIAALCESLSQIPTDSLLVVYKFSISLLTVITGLTISRNEMDRNGLKRLTISQNGTDDTVYRRAIHVLTKYQVNNTFERSPRLSNSSTILLKKELPSSLPPVNPKVGKI